MQKLIYLSKLNILLFFLASLSKTDVFGCVMYAPTYAIKPTTMYKNNVFIVETDDIHLMTALDSAFPETKFVSFDDEIFTSVIEQTQ